MGIYTPHKSVCMNGLKFSVIAFHPSHQKIFQDLADILLGGLSLSAVGAIAAVAILDIGGVNDGVQQHSLRHRAKDRLRAEGCPLDIQYELLGHETKTVASGYGHGSPVPLLRKWLDKVGF